MKDLLKQIEKEIRRIEDAMKKGKKYGQIKMRGDVSKDAIKLMKRIKAYKKLTGKKRISKQEKEALIEFTPKQVKRSMELSPKTFERRKKKFEKDYGFVNPLIEKELKFGGPKRVAKKYGLIDEEKEKEEKKTIILGPVTVEEEETKDEEWDTFTNPVVPNCGWDELKSVGIGKWSRKSGTFLYNNSGFLWSSGMVQMDRIINYGTDGNDYTKYEFFELVFPIVYSEILFDPEQTGNSFFVYKNEWDEVEELSPDYIISRRYKRKNN